MIGLSLIIGFLSTLAFLLAYRVVDRLTMFLPLFLIWAVWMAYGFEVVLKLLESWLINGSLQRRALVMSAARLAGVSFGAFVFLWNLPLVERENTTVYRAKAEMIMNQVGEDAVIFGYWDAIPILQYLQLVEHEREDVTLMNRFLINDLNARKYIQSIAGKRPIYSTDSTLLAGNKITNLDGMELYQIVDPDQALTQTGRNP